eukprot:4061206-Ditylum_brightwellii.AAC.1
MASSNEQRATQVGQCWVVSGCRRIKILKQALKNHNESNFHKSNVLRISTVKSNRNEIANAFIGPRAVAKKQAEKEKNRKYAAYLVKCVVFLAEG